MVPGGFLLPEHPDLTDLLVWCDHLEEAGKRSPRNYLMADLHPQVVSGAWTWYGQSPAIPLCHIACAMHFSGKGFDRLDHAWQAMATALNNPPHAYRLSEAMRGYCLKRLRLATSRRHEFEVGLRSDASGEWVPNSLAWDPDADLGDLVKLEDLSEVGLVGNAAVLDVYCYKGGSLDTNVDLWIGYGQCHALAYGGDYLDLCDPETLPDAN